jgi:hypothetical protein
VSEAGPRIVVTPIMPAGIFVRLGEYAIGGKIQLCAETEIKVRGLAFLFRHYHSKGLIRPDYIH